MIGWLELTEAEDLALDLHGGDDWRESAALSFAEGTFTSSAPYKAVGSVAGLTGGVLYQDLPFLIVNETAPEYEISRAGTELDGSVATHAVLTESQVTSFTRKRRLLLEAFERILALVGYAITRQTAASDELKRAQLQIAIDALNDASGAREHARLRGAGVKRDRRGKAETEYFPPDELGAGDTGGLSSAALAYLSKYKIDEGHGAVLLAGKL